MPSTDLMNTCTDFCDKSSENKKYIFNSPQKHMIRQEPQNHDFLSIAAFMGDMKFQLSDGISVKHSPYSPTLPLGKKTGKAAQNLLVKTTVTRGREKDLQGNYKANMIKTSRDLTPLLFYREASCCRERCR